MWQPDQRLTIGHDLGMLLDAATAAVRVGSVSNSSIQRHVRVGFAKAGRLRLLLEQEGIIDSSRGTAGRHQSLVAPGGLDAALSRIREAAGKETGNG